MCGTTTRRLRRTPTVAHHPITLDDEMLSNYGTREITAKIVYYGPGMCGKTTNLEQVHARVDPAQRGRFHSLKTEDDRTLFFDMLPVDAGEIRGFSLKFLLTTVPGQVYYNNARRRVLKNVDGVVFVADSREPRLDANIESMYNLYDNMSALGHDMNEIPLVIQYNKRDLADSLPVAILEDALNPEVVPAWEAVAMRGEGVFQTLDGIIGRVETSLRERL